VLLSETGKTPAASHHKESKQMQIWRNKGDLALFTDGMRWIAERWGFSIKQDKWFHRDSACAYRDKWASK
jgi:hypothetical protein